IKPLMVNRGHMDSRRCILTADVLAGQIDSAESLGSDQEFSEFSDRQLESLFQMNFKIIAPGLAVEGRRRSEMRRSLVDSQNSSTKLFDKTAIYEQYTTFVANVALRKLLESADNSMEAARLQARAKQSMDDLERIKLEMLSRAEGGTKKTTEPKQSPVVLTAGERRLNSDVRYDGFLMRDAVKYMAPTDLVEKFLRVAEPNTSRNLETCAILLGTTNEPGATAGSPSVIRITHLFVPQQSGTSDSCEASEDSDVEVLDFALNNGLVCIGWIHTHPSQSCFLSSIDLHTSLGYQVLCNEALALVVAPTDSQYQPCGVFRLTEYGIAYLKTCHRRGFHKHSDAQMPLYEVVGPQEWRLVSDTGVSIVDRRMRPHPSVQHFTKEQLDAFREAKLEERREQMRQERAKFKQYMEMDQERE
ncbi:hypothetical protein FOZ63_029790, partial [Perkinsus olseni]